MDGKVPPSNGNDLSTLMTREQKRAIIIRALCVPAEPNMSTLGRKKAKKTKEIRIMHETFEFMQGFSGGGVEGYGVRVVGGG